jgi:alkanesulfonate monooxygenase SsuD/methylene tetrahydromethanopterin reductase-like flavin-dependent oxidoreductase (luciferase family)
MSTPEIGVFLPTMSAPGDPLADVAATARHAEQLGLRSAWAVDQLVAGTGAPIVDSVVALAAAAGATSQIELGLGVMILPLRPVVWVAKQVASLQAISGGRLLFGVGVGGDRHDASWEPAGVQRSQRGPRTDAALDVLRDLIAGKPTALPDVAGRPTVQLAPGVDPPPIVIGGGGEAALRRAVRAGDAWLALPVPPDAAAPTIARLRQLADEASRPAPEVIGSVMIAIDDDASLPDEAELTRQIADPDGVFGIPAERVETMLVRGSREQVAERIAAWGALGARRVVVSIAGGDWFRQAELVASAVLLAS